MYLSIGSVPLGAWRAIARPKGPRARPRQAWPGTAAATTDSKTVPALIGGTDGATGMITGAISASRGRLISPARARRVSHGLSVGIYSDRHTIFWSSGTSGSAAGTRQTQVGRALEAAAIAGSPPAHRMPMPRPAPAGKRLTMSIFGQQPKRPPVTAYPASRDLRQATPVHPGRTRRGSGTAPAGSAARRAAAAPTPPRCGPRHVPRRS